MFDVGFTELVLILVVSLLVLGPERLPGAIRTTGLWIARLRRSFNEIRTEIEREAHFDEIKRDLHNQSILDSLKGTADDLGKLRDLPYDVSDVVARSARTKTTPAPPGRERHADRPPSTAAIAQEPANETAEAASRPETPMQDVNAPQVGPPAAQITPTAEQAPPLPGGSRQP